MKESIKKCALICHDLAFVTGSWSCCFYCCCCCCCCTPLEKVLREFCACSVYFVAAALFFHFISIISYYYYDYFKVSIVQISSAFFRVLFTAEEVAGAAPNPKGQKCANEVTHLRQQKNLNDDKDSHQRPNNSWLMAAQTQTQIQHNSFIKLQLKKKK